MPTLEAIRQQIDDLGDAAGCFGTRSEINSLPGIIQAAEQIKALTSGFLNERTWLIVCTNRRLLFLDNGWFWRVHQLDIPLEKINSFEFRSGFFFGEFTVYDGSTKSVVGKIRKGTLQPFVNAINVELERIRARNHSPQVILNVADQIRKLAELRRQQILTEDEFQKQKTKLLEL